MSTKHVLHYGFKSPLKNTYVSQPTNKHYAIQSDTFHITAEGFEKYSCNK